MIFPDLENNDIPRRTLRKKPNNLKATREVSAYEKMLATRIANHLISQQLALKQLDFFSKQNLS